MIAFSGHHADTSTCTNWDDNLTSTTSSEYRFIIEYREEYKKENPEWIEPLSHRPEKGTFKQSRGSYKGISKSAKNKFKKINKRYGKSRRRI